MRGPDPRILLAVGLLAAACGCASTMAPSGRLPRAGEAGDARGGWIVAELREPAAGHMVAGELIAIGQDTVFVLTESGLEALPEAELRAAQVASYQSASGELALWTCLGTLSTASHGVLLILTAPGWILGGTICTVAASGAGIHRYPQLSLGELAPFARFPQGLPPEVRGSGLLQNRPAVTPPTSPKN